MLAISFVALQPSYDTCDDVFMTMFASGQGLASAPDEHLVFSNVLIGHLLKRLYTAWPQIPWYGCYLLAVHYAAQVALLYGALAADREFPAAGNKDGSAATRFRRRFALYLVYFAIVEWVFLNNLQFTTTAFLAAQGGMVLLWHAARCRLRQAAVVLPLCAAVALLVAAALIRLEGLLMALLVAAPLGILLARRLPLRAVVPSAMAAAIAASLILLANAYNRAAYEQDPRWSGFFAYNQLRCKFNDYRWTSYTPQTAALFSSVGWTKSDHDMIANWFYDDAAVYSQANLRTVLEGHPWKTARLTPAYYREVCRKLLQDRAVWASFLVLPFFLVSVDPEKPARRAVLSCALLAVALIVFLVFNNKLPPMRIYFPLVSFPLLAAIMLPPGRAAQRLERAGEADVAGGSPRACSRWQPPRPRVRLVVILLVVGIVMGVYHQCRRSVKVRRDRQTLAAFLANGSGGNRVLHVCWEAALPFELVSPLDNLHAWSRIPLVSLTWTQQTPWHEEIKRRFGITSLVRAICERDDILVVSLPTHREVLAEYVKEHFQADVEFVELFRGNKRFVAGRFELRARPGETVRKQDESVKR
ncbi:MAG: hypothetical protein WDZ48_06440 [Pirellulales bacterium]